MLLDAEIDLLSNNTQAGRQVGALGVSIIIALVIATLKETNNINILLITLIYGGSIYAIFYMLSLLIRTKEEKLREFKLFLITYVTDV